MRRLPFRALRDMVSEEEYRAVSAYLRSRVYLIEHEGAVMLFLPHAGDMYEVHYLKKGTPQACKAIISGLFTFTTAKGIWGLTPRDFRAARVLNRWLGASLLGERVVNDKLCLVYELRRDTWVI